MASPRRAIRPKPWRCLLVLAGDNVAVWEHPYHTRHPHILPYWIASATDPADRPSDQPGFASLPEAIAFAALTEHALRNGGVNQRHVLAQSAVRPVLWETQHTQSCIRAKVEVQRAVTVALTQSNPSRATFARLLSKQDGGFDRD